MAPARVLTCIYIASIAIKKQKQTKKRKDCDVIYAMKTPQPFERLECKIKNFKSLQLVTYLFIINLKNTLVCDRYFC